MAWLNAVPLPPEGSKAADPRFKRERVTRRAKMKADGIPITMPPCSADSVVKNLMELGQTEAAGMGLAPLSWSAIDAWQRATGIDLPPWELRLLRHLSIQYLAESRQAESENCPPPWRSRVSQGEINAEQAALIAVLG